MTGHSIVRRLVVALGIIGCAAAASAEVRRTFYENGGPKSETPLVEGQVHGIYREFYASGKLAAAIPHVKGSRHGVAQWYYENGRVRGEIPYLNGKKDGLEREFYDTGVVRKETPYALGGHVHGMYNEYAASGKLTAAIPHVKGSRHGVAQWYYENGRVSGEIPYLNGQKEGVEREFYPSGGVRKESPYAAGNLQGVYREYDDILQAAGTTPSAGVNRADSPGLRIVSETPPAGETMSSPTEAKWFRIEATVVRRAVSTRADYTLGTLRMAIPHVKGARLGLAKWFHANSVVSHQRAYDQKGDCGPVLDFDDTGKLTKTTPGRACQSGAPGDDPSQPGTAAPTAKPQGPQIASLDLTGDGRLVEVDEDGRERVLAAAGSTSGLVTLSHVSGDTYRSKRLRLESETETTFEAMEVAR